MSIGKKIILFMYFLNCKVYGTVCWSNTVAFLINSTKSPCSNFLVDSKSIRVCVRPFVLLTYGSIMVVNILSFSNRSLMFINSKPNDKSTLRVYVEAHLRVGVYTMFLYLNVCLQ